MQVETRPLGKPVPDRRGLVPSAVVEDEMNVQTAGHLCFDLIEEATKLLRPVAAVQLANHATSLGP